MISDGQDANAAVTNAAFVSKTVSDAKVGDLTLNDKLSLQDSGSATMTDAQLEINNLKDEFNPSTGHDHDGTDSKKVLATNLDSTGGSNGQVLKADGAGLVTWENDTGTGAVNYKGSWNANTNTPTLTSGAGAQGDYYVVSVLGTTTLDGISDWEVTDWAVFNGTIWEKIDNTDTVVSVAGKTGAVTLDADDISETSSKFWAYKSNVTAIDPTVSNDSSQGYSVGSRWWNSSTNTLFIAESVGVGTAVWEGVSGSGGGGGLDVYHSETFETTVAADFTTGNNATFDNGGTLQGTLLDETTNPINGLSSLKYTQAVGSLNDWVKSPLINIFDKQGGNETGVTLYFTYDGDASDIKFVLYDETNTTILTDVVDVFTSESNPTRFALSAYIPSGVTQLAYGFQVLVENSGAILLLDDIELSTNPFVYKNITERAYATGASNAGGAFTDSVTDIDFTETSDSNGNFNGTSYIVSNNESNIIINGNISMTTSANWYIGLFVNGLVSKYYIDNAPSSSARKFTFVLTPSEVQAGDSITIRIANGSGTLAAGASTHWISIVEEWDTENIISATKNVSNVFSARIDSTGTVISESESFISSITPVGTGDYTINFNSNLFSVPPAVTLTAAPTGGTQANVSMVNAPTTTSVRYRSGDLAATLINVEVDIIVQRQGTDVKTPIVLTAIPTLRTAYIKDVKSSGTNGGTFTSGVWQTRDLNTLEGDTGFIGLNANQFTLQAGKYELEADTPSFQSDQHKAKVRNITDSTDELIGSSEFIDNITQAVTTSKIKGQLLLTSSKTFEIQHRGTTTQATTGFGVASGLGVDEIYTQVKITKVK